MKQLQVMVTKSLTLSLLLVLAVFTAPRLQADEAQVERGRAMFVANCAACHGENAKGGRGSDLTTGRWRWGGSDTELTLSIRQGIPGTQMPPASMSEEEALDIVAFLRTLSQKKKEPVTGNAEKGREIFYGAGRCSTCHFFGGHGGRLGPDLTKIRDGKGVSDLKKAINEPSESLRPGFETVEVEFEDSRVVEGSRRNEDTFSIQFMDREERLHFLLKEELRRVTPIGRSLMPKADLDSSQVEDLVAFLLKSSPQEAAAAAKTRWQPADDLNVTSKRLREAQLEPQNWLTYWGDLPGRHYSGLNQITPQNVDELRLAWTYQFGGTNVETTPIVADGLMFVTGPKNDAAALDARTGRTIWQYRRPVPDDVRSFCTVMTNRGFAMLGDRLYMATLDTRLVALDAKTGNVVWDVAVDDYKKGYSITLAPLAMDGKIFVGVTSGECGLNGFLDAFDAETGEKLWRFWAIPQEGDPARETWAGDSAEFGGGPTWLTGTYDADLKTLYWTTGNPAPDYDGSVREGDNLYSDSVVALDPDTGRLKWHFQHTPHDTHDWDSNQDPVLIDAEFQGRQRKLLIQANRNGFYYVLDRETGEFLLGRPYVTQTWADGLDSKGRPIVIPNTDPTEEGNRVCPDAWGGTNWSAPSFSPDTGLFYVLLREACATYTSKTKEPIAGRPYTGTGQQLDPGDSQPGAIAAIDPLTGDIRWRFGLHEALPTIGVLATKGGLVFGGTYRGHFVALDAANGALLWRRQLGSAYRSSPMSYAVGGTQYVAIAAESVLYTFSLP
ncbi:MAG: PQQ-dependent dehydrogenase, methanol/ethanol family [Acidobacteria bacterium]|nr:PQQ-dependent dehydrogenase, methanol/ethanol family [Acidobacteriota bacterium]